MKFMKKNTATHEKFFHKTYFYNHYSQLWYAESLLANTSLTTDIQEYRFNTLRNTKRLSHLENSNQLRKFIHAERKPYSYIAEINEKRVNEIKKRAHISARPKRVLRIFAQLVSSYNCFSSNFLDTLISMTYFWFSRHWNTKCKIINVYYLYIFICVHKNLSLGNYALFFGRKNVSNSFFAWPAKILFNHCKYCH